MYSNKKIIQSLGEIFKGKGISHLVISPGSRNAPISIHFSYHSFFLTYSIVDERCAAFFAMGLSRELKAPVILNCTSGTALANYYPALIESYYQNIPLIILSADLPKELIDVFDGQTIRQKNIFKNHVVASIEINENLEDLYYNERLINTAINEGILWQKPIHINLPLSEPLYQTTKEISVNPKIINFPKRNISVEKKEIKNYQEIWQNAKKKLILIGQTFPDKNFENDLISLLSNDPSVVVLSESLGNLNYEKFIFSIDKMLIPLSDKKWNEYKPELLISMGGNIISKKLKLFLRASSSFSHWHLDELATNAIDTYQNLSVDFRISKSSFFKYFKFCKGQNSDYRKKWEILSNYRKERHFLFLKNIPFCDLKAFEIILKKIPKNTNLELGNSTVVRYHQLFENKKGISCFANRGTSGIDGSLSTAIGGALGSKKPTTLIIGDISFFYDSNGLWNNYIPKNFRVILINNGGGNIFKFIFGPDSTNVLEKHFETKHSMNAKALCETYKWEYFSSKDENSLKNSLNSFWNSSNLPRLLEVDTKKIENAQILKNYYEFIN